MTAGGQPTYWTDREPGEPVADWVTRLAVCYLVSKSLARQELVPTSRNIPSWWVTIRHQVPVPPRGCGEHHAGECTSEYPYTARRA